MTFKPAPWPRQLRSQHWYGGTSRDTIYHRGWMKNQGWPHDLFDGRPVIGILNTWSELNSCHAHFRERAGDVKRGVLAAGGFPVELPSLSVDESFTKPTSMLYRNMLAMETEELLRARRTWSRRTAGARRRSWRLTGWMSSSLATSSPRLWDRRGPASRR